jgi:hypothetical protein
MHSTLSVNALYIWPVTGILAAQIIIMSLHIQTNYSWRRVNLRGSKYQQKEIILVNKNLGIFNL